MRYTHFFSSLAAATLTLALPSPSPLSADPAGSGNVGNGAGQQFITGGCLSDADCQTQCCATFSGGGICSAVAVQFDQGKQGCGFGGTTFSSAASASSSAVPRSSSSSGSSSSSVVDISLAGSQNVGLGNAAQFITGQCLSDADCASGCCAGNEASAIAACSGPDVSFASGKTGCGFVAS